MQTFKVSMCVVFLSLVCSLSGCGPGPVENDEVGVRHDAQYSVQVTEPTPSFTCYPQAGCKCAGAASCLALIDSGKCSGKTFFCEPDRNQTVCYCG